MPTFYATLSASQRKAHGFRPSPHGGGYVEIEAKDYETAHQLMFNRFGARWAFLYTSLDEVHELDRWLLAEEKDRMDPTWKALWVKDLRTPGLRQGKGYLTQFNVVEEREDCCLGRLCEVMMIPWQRTEFVLSYEDTTTILPDSVMSLTGIGENNPIIQVGLRRDELRDRVSLAELNDEGFTFPQIADVIEHFL